MKAKLEWTKNRSSNKEITEITKNTEQCNIQNQPETIVTVCQCSNLLNPSEHRNQD